MLNLLLEESAAFIKLRKLLSVVRHLSLHSLRHEARTTLTWLFHRIPYGCLSQPPQQGVSANVR